MDNCCSLFTSRTAGLNFVDIIPAYFRGWHVCSVASCAVSFRAFLFCWLLMSSNVVLVNWVPLFVHEEGKPEKRVLHLWVREDCHFRLEHSRTSCLGKGASSRVREEMFITLVRAI